MPVVGAEEQVSEYGAAIHHRHRLVQVGILGAIDSHLGHKTREEGWQANVMPQQHRTSPGILSPSQGLSRLWPS